jgi:hypothetical protein
MNVEVVKGSKVSPRGALDLPAARFLQTKRFDPLPKLSVLIRFPLVGCFSKLQVGGRKNGQMRRRRFF